MKINRDNYQIWFIDWLDNNLTNRQIEELDLFLEQNPELRTEFTDLCTIGLKPFNSCFEGKEKLRKSAAELPGMQFEILCAASAENDLNTEQQAELIDMISGDPARKRTFEVFKRLKLKSPDIYLNHKNKLYRATPATKVIRIAITTISAAAMIAIIFMTGILKKQPEVNIPVIAYEDPIHISEAVEIITTKDPVNRSGISPVTETKEKNADSDSNHEKNTQILPETHKEATVIPQKIVYNKQTVSVKDNSPEPSLIAASQINPEDISIEPDETRSNIGRLIARTFRGKVLDEQLPSDAPLKGYEIAEAGIDGLNKLLGWEMALTRNTDEKGNLKSVNFNSRMLKFNAPVKNNQSAE